MFESQDVIEAGGDDLFGMYPVSPDIPKSPETTQDLTSPTSTRSRFSYKEEHKVAILLEVMAAKPWTYEKTEETKVWEQIAFKLTFISQLKNKTPGVAIMRHYDLMMDRFKKYQAEGMKAYVKQMSLKIVKCLRHNLILVCFQVWHKPKIHRKK